MRIMHAAASRLSAATSQPRRAARAVPPPPSTRRSGISSLTKPPTYSTPQNKSFHLRPLIVTNNCFTIPVSEHF